MSYGGARPTLFRVMLALTLIWPMFAAPASAFVGHPAPQSELSAYELPDGSLPILCLNDQIIGETDNRADHGCELCCFFRLSTLPLPGQDIVGRLAALGAIFGPGSTGPDLIVVRIGTRGPRAPPRAG
ncbi:MAG: hypothetical protein AAF468_05860 [Pseudomonadota bacterium]